MNSRIPSSNEEINLPFGFVFSPTDAELMEDYLLPKLKGKKLPSNYIVDLKNVYQYDPDHLPYKLKHAREKEAYFFTTDDLRNYSADDEEQGRIRATPGGYWKVYVDEVPIYRANKLIGFKTKRYFHNKANGYLTDWKMNEFRCNPSRIPTATPTLGESCSSIIQEFLHLVLVEGYLIPKLKGQKLPSNYIVDLKNIYQYDPHHLPYKKLKHARENEAYFFTSDDLTKNYEGNIRDTPGGYWEVDFNRDKVEIYCAGKVIGFKTRLLFYNNNNIEEEDFTNCNNEEENFTNWKMIQFRCHPSRIPTATHTTENYIVCKIKLRMKEDEVLDYVEVISEDENDTNGGNF